MSDEPMQKASNELSTEVFDNLQLIPHKSLVGYLMQDETILLAFGTPVEGESDKTGYLGLKLSLQQAEYLGGLIEKMIAEVPVMQARLKDQAAATVAARNVSK